MKYFKIIVIIIMTVFLFQSCATSKFVVTGNIYPSYNGPVNVFQSQPEGVEYEEIGIVSSSGGEIHEWTHLIEAMQKSAASYGANAIIIIKEDKTQTGSVAYTQYGLYGGTTQYKSLMAVAIKIK